MIYTQLPKQKIENERKILSVLNTGIFEAKILLNNGFTYDELMEELREQECDGWMEAISLDKELFDNVIWAASQRIVEKDNSKYYYFFLWIKNPFQFDDDDFVKLAHEVLHIVSFLLHDILDRDREYECEAYLHTHIMRQAIKVLRGEKDEG